MRACILGVIPGDFVEDAIAECEKTMRGDNNEPLSDRIRKMIAVFGEFNVSQEMIEARFGHSAESIIEIELVLLRKMYLSIKDNMASVHDHFPPVDGEAPADNGKSKSENLANKLENKQAGNGKEPEASEPTDPEPTPDAKPTFESFEAEMKAAPDLKTLTEVKDRALAAANAPNGLPMDDWKRLTALFSELKKSFDTDSVAS